MISRVITRATILRTLIRGLVPLKSTDELPSASRSGHRL